MREVVEVLYASGLVSCIGVAVYWAFVLEHYIIDKLEGRR